MIHTFIYYTCIWNCPGFIIYNKNTVNDGPIINIPCAFLEKKTIYFLINIDFSVLGNL